MPAVGGEHRTRFPRFVVVGTIGFLVDAGGFLILVELSGISIYLARVASFFFAVCVTYYLNRTYTFRTTSTRIGHSFSMSAYFLVQCLGAFLNYGMFVFSLWMMPVLLKAPVVAVAIGSGVAMISNYLGAHYVAFRGPERED